MKIVHYVCTARVADGGVPKAAVDLSMRVAGEGHNVTFLTWDDEICPQSWKDGTEPNVKLVMLTSPERKLGLFSERQLGLFEEAIKGADAVHLHAMWTTSNLQVAAMARRLGVPYVLSPHGMLDDWCMAQSSANKRVFMLLFGRRLLKGAAAVHFTAQAELDQARKLLPHDRTRVLPLVFDMGPYEKLPGVHLASERFNIEAESGAIRLLFLSRIHPKKGLERLLRAAQTLAGPGSGVRLLIAGTGEAAYEQEIKALAERLGVADHVRFLGPVTGAMKVSLYQLADLFVLPTSQENFGFVFFEALAAGTPLVTTRAVDTWRELEASGAAHVFELPAGEDASARATAGAIKSALAPRPLLRERGQKGRAWVLEAMSPARITGEFVRLYQDARGLMPRA